MQIQEMIEQVNEALAKIEFHFPFSQQMTGYEKELKEAHIYPLAAGGKRIRPLMTLLSAGSVCGAQGIQTAEKAAMAIELMHTYTLVHDDLPCMDNDDLRRGRPTTHKIFGESKALLVGDGLQAQAFLLLSQADWQQKKDYTKDLLAVLAEAASPNGVIWGQWLDISLTGKEETSWKTMETVHTYKTGVFIAASLEMGLLCGLSQLSQQLEVTLISKLREKIKKAGIYIGLAFQIIDDILDATKTSAELGKTAGKDEQQNKFTAIRILGKEKSQELSTQYTNIAMTLLKEIFAEFQTAKNNDENNHYQNLLLQQIQILLARSN